MRTALTLCAFISSDVAAHELLGHHAPPVGVELVAVDAAQQHPPAVDLQQPVLDDHGAEADPQLHPLARADDLGVVEARDLRAPRLRARHRDGLARGDVQPELGHEHARRGVRVHAQRAGAAHVVVVRVHEHVLEPAGGPRQHRDAAEDARHPPHVLVLEVGPGGPLVHTHGEDVLLARPHRLADLELHRQAAAHRHAQLDAVEPRTQARVGALEPQHRVHVPPAGRHGEAPPVVARRVLVGHVRRLDRERIDDVRVGRRAVAVQLPERRHGQAVPGGVVVVRRDEVERGVRPPGQAERPLAVERQRRRVRAQEGARGVRAAAGAPVLVVAVRHSVPMRGLSPSRSRPSTRSASSAAGR